MDPISFSLYKTCHCNYFNFYYVFYSEEKVTRAGLKVDHVVHVAVTETANIAKVEHRVLNVIGAISIE